MLTLEKNTQLNSVRPKLTLPIFLRAIRVHQYTKNLLIFLPLFLGQYYSQPHLILLTGLGYLCFCITASSVYLLNDLIDINADRLHPTKKFRALASGAMKKSQALALSISFLIVATSISFMMPPSFQLTIASYYVLTLAYSFYFKRQLLLDVIVLSGLYTLRICAGMVLLNNGYSDWLILFSLFFFTSLAFIKRFIELNQAVNTKLPGRAYHTDHVQMISLFGIASGYLSTLVFALYINSEKATLLYHYTKLLYLICPILLYWISYIWLCASNGRVPDDPVTFALTDKTSYLTFLFICAITVVAIL